ncbi:MAG: hypothetical protein U0821_22560 [Chloroflexota bacterium]
MAENTTTWVGVAKETFERSMLPWVGRYRADWLAAWSKPHPADPGQVLVSEHIHSVYQARATLEPISQAQLKQMGYPKKPS